MFYNQTLTRAGTRLAKFDFGSFLRPALQADYAILTLPGAARRNRNGSPQRGADLRLRNALYNSGVPLKRSTSPAR